MANQTLSCSRSCGLTGLAFFAAVYTLQALATLFYFIEPFAIRSFGLWYVTTWGLAGLGLYLVHPVAPARPSCGLVIADGHHHRQ